MDEIPAWLIDLLREARDTVQASTAEADITTFRREYREGLGQRLDRAYILLRGAVPQEDIMRAALENPQPKDS